MTDRPFSHPNFGKEARIEQYGREVHLIFVAGTKAQADDLVEVLLAQLKAGSLQITVMGSTPVITEDGV